MLTRSSSIQIALCFSRSGTDTGFAGSNSRFSRAIWISSTVIVRCRGIEGGLERTKADAAALQLVYEADQLAPPLMGGIAEHWGVSESFFILGAFMLLLCVPLGIIIGRIARHPPRAKT